MAMVYMTDAYGQGLASSVTTNMQALGAPLPSPMVQVPETVISDYSSQAQQVVNSGAQCLGLVTYDDVGAAFVRELANQRKMNPNALPADFFVVGTDGVYDQGFITDAQNNPSNADAGNAADNVVFGTSPDSAPPTPEYLAFRDLYSASYPLAEGEDTASYVSNSYDAAMLMILAIQQAGSVDNAPPSATRSTRCRAEARASARRTSTTPCAPSAPAPTSTTTAPRAAAISTTAATSSPTTSCGT